MAEQKQRLVVEIASLESPASCAVVCAAMELFPAGLGVEVVLCVAEVDEPDAAHADVVSRWCHEATSGQVDQLPDVVLAGWAEAHEEAALHVASASAVPAEAARAIALLTALAENLWTAKDEAPAETPETAAPQATGDTKGTDPDAVLHRQQVLTAIARRDVRRARQLGPDGKPHVALLFQHVSYWGAVEGVLGELSRRDDIVLDVVAVRSGVDLRAGTSADFLAARGVPSRTADWLREHLDEIDLLVLDNPYDETRGAQLTAPQLAQRGVRLAALPYGNNAIGGAFMTKLLWDLPLHRLAWRYYLGTATQRSLFARHCAAGDDPVRVLGSPRADRLLAGTSAPWTEELSGRAAGRPIVVWNPHFRVEPGGWSTFSRYLGQVLAFLRGHDDLVLVVRPHFRLFEQLRRHGLGSLEADLRDAAFELDNLVIDESADYLPALCVADAMMSDLSSLASDFSATGRPLLYLHRADGPQPNDEGSCFLEMQRADTWAEVQRWLEALRTGSVSPRDGSAPTSVATTGAARRIVEDMVCSLRGELFLDEELEPVSEAVAGDSSAHDVAVDPQPDLPTLPSGRTVQDWVVLQSFGGLGTGGNPRALADELDRVGHSARRFWVVRAPSQPVPPGCEPLLRGSADHQLALERARWVVDNDAVPATFTRRPDQVLLQTWHGTPLKRLRWDLHEINPRSEEALRAMEHDVAQWSTAVSPNPLTTEVLRRGFRFRGEVLESGYPRNDVLADEVRRAERADTVRRALAIPDGARVVLFAPTWRDDALVGQEGQRTYSYQHAVDWGLVARQLGDAVILFRSHRFVTESRRRRGRARGAVDVSHYPDMADLLALADVLVTDYSSSFFDYALTGRPMLFYTPDLERYRGLVRGHYFALEDVAPGPVLRRAEELVEALLALPQVSEEFAGRYERFRSRFAPWDDGKAAQRVVEQVF
jgi:CDP-glycerol glycerophosphotransferase (TagB/SpsB family)